MKNVLIALLALITIFFTSCGPSIDGNGNVIKKEYEVENFEQIKVNGGFKVYLRQNNKAEVILETDDNLLDYITVEVNDNELLIEPKQRIGEYKMLNIYISAKNIDNIDLNGAVELISKSKIKSKQLSIDGSGAVDIDLDIDIRKLNIDISGASEIDLKGETDKLSVDISGAGELNAFELISENVTIDISGAGSAKVNVTEELEVDITGAGSVIYKGNPEKIDKHITGAGSVEKR